MKAPTKISISERPPPTQPSGIKDIQVKALRRMRDTTLSETEFQQATVALIAMGETP